MSVKKILCILFCMTLMLTIITNAIGVNKMLKNNALKNKLTKIQYCVTQENGTEIPFKNKYWDNKKSGIYVDIISGEPLFSSTEKFTSGTGWPSFKKPLVKNNIIEKKDISHNMLRIEVRSKKADSHLGHVFNDGPGYNGLRYCINSASLKFIPVNDLKKEGYEKFLYLFEKNSENIKTATFAAGCFWGVEDLFKKLNGVIKTTVGYTGGETESPTYREICSGNTGHAEAVLIKYNEKYISYKELVAYFFRLHDPTTLNRQGADIGSQYRSAIFFHNEEQKLIAENYIKEIKQIKKFKNPITTEIKPASVFYHAENYHQDYFEKNQKSSCHLLSD